MTEPINDYAPAFPNVPSDPAYTKWNEGLTFRDWFASRAPAEIPYWFVPSMPMPRPESQWVDEAGQPASQALDPCTFRQNTLVNAAAIDEWEMEYGRQRLAQWPWAYADLVLSARKAVKP